MKEIMKKIILLVFLTTTFYGCSTCQKYTFSGLFFQNPKPSGNYEMFKEKKIKNPELSLNYDFVGQVLENPESLCSLRKDQTRTMNNGVIYKRPQKSIEIITAYIGTSFKTNYKIIRDTIFNDYRTKNNNRIEFQTHQIFVENNNKKVGFTFFRLDNKWLCFNVSTPYKIHFPHVKMIH